MSQNSRAVGVEHSVRGIDRQRSIISDCVGGMGEPRHQLPRRFRLGLQIAANLRSPGARRHLAEERGRRHLQDDRAGYFGKPLPNAINRYLYLVTKPKNGRLNIYIGSALPLSLRLSFSDQVAS